ncbi:DUF502 domain-containing protein [Paracoccaceae bacterium GXU_MW_L88]
MQKPSLFQRLQANFFTGLVVVMPILLTMWLIMTMVNFIDARVLPFLPGAYNPQTYLGKNIFGYGVLVFVVFTTLIGAVTKGMFGRQLLRMTERLVDRTPVVRNIYGGVKQIIETILSQNGNNFQQVCLVEYPRKGIWCIVFVSTDTTGEIPHKAGHNDLVSVFLPTTPNPTSGFLLFVPREDLTLLSMSVEEAAKLIISGGLVTPEYVEDHIIEPPHQTDIPHV